MVVEDLADVLPDADLPSAHALGLDRVGVAHDPVADVEVVDVLLDDVVAAEPGEVSTSCGPGTPFRSWPGVRRRIQMPSPFQ